MAGFQNFIIRHFGPACLAGITFTDWVRLLAENRFQISPQYIGKGMYITGNSLITSVLRGVEELIYSKQLASTEYPAPVFVLGCWRSGTTHLHNVLCQDPQFVAPNLYQTMYPHTFLTTERVFRPLLDLLTPSRRFMDNMKMGLAEPAEDEIALTIATQCSNMLSWTFPKSAARYDAFLDFTSASAAERTLWKQQFDRFIRKVVLQNGKRPILKSPNHTARIQLLLEMAPHAKFVHIRRNPYDVYRSFCHMAREVIPVWGLQTYSDDISNMVIDTYQRLYAAYFEQKKLIPAGQLHEISYEELIQSPLPVLETLYQSLDLGDFAAVQKSYEQYVKSNSSYQRNRHSEIPAPILEKINSRWAPAFEAWGYERLPATASANAAS